MRGTKKIIKKWKPDPKLIPLLKPFYDRGFPAYVAADLLLRNNNGDVVKNPNVKTYFKYWRFWKEKALEEQRQKNILTMIRKQKEFEYKYFTAYDKLILVAYEMENTLESCRKYKRIGLFGYENYDKTIPHIDIDLNLESMILRITKLWTYILQSKFNIENDIILYNINKKKFDRNLQKLYNKTHKLLLRVVHFLAKQNNTKATLDCQMNKKTPESIVIKCGICTAIPMIQKVN